MILTVTLNPSVDETLCISGLKPHDTNRVVSVDIDAGGKGVNLSRVVAELGEETVATGFVGGRTGAMVLQVLEEQGVKGHFVKVKRPTRTVVNVESGDGPPTTFNGKGGKVTKDAWNHLVENVRNLSVGASWVALGGSVPEGLPCDAYVCLAEVARKNGAKILIDVDGETLKSAIAFGPDLIKPNSNEASQLLGWKVKSAEQAEKAALELREMLVKAGRQDGMVILSRGAVGAVLATKDGVKTYKAFKVEAKSSVGSGDSMLGGFLVGLVNGKSLDECMRIALAAGAATAMSDGASIARKEDIQALLARK